MAGINQGQEAHRQHHSETNFGVDGKQHTSRTRWEPGRDSNNACVCQGNDECLPYWRLARSQQS